MLNRLRPVAPARNTPKLTTNGRVSREGWPDSVSAASVGGASFRIVGGAEREENLSRRGFVSIFVIHMYLAERKGCMVDGKGEGRGGGAGVGGKGCVLGIESDRERWVTSTLVDFRRYSRGFPLLLPIANAGRCPSTG